jgi:hypothetical protein
MPLGTNWRISSQLSFTHNPSERKTKKKLKVGDSVQQQSRFY